MREGIIAARAAAVDQPSSAQRTYVLFALLFVYTLAFIDRQIVGILAVPIKAELGLSDTQIALMGGLAFAVFYTTVSIPVAWLADRWNRTSIIAIALTIWSGFTALCGFAASFVHLFLCRIGVGIGEAGGTTPAIAVITDYFPEKQRTRALAVYSFGIPLGSALGILVGGSIAAWVDWRAAFITVGVIGLIAMPILKLTVRETARRETAAGALTAPMPFWSLVALLARKPTFWATCLGASCCSVVGYGFSFWLPSFFVRSHDVPLSQTALQFGLVVLVGGIAGEWIGGSIADRLGSRFKRVYALAPACSMYAAAALYAIGLLLPSNPYLLVYFLLPVIAYFSTSGSVYQCVHKLVPASARATVTSLLLFFNTVLGLGLGSLFYGLVSDALRPSLGEESLRYTMLCALGFLVTGASLYLFASTRLIRDQYQP